ncbi:hypothetical protein N7499_004906 [Penicillium canescens]|uniref:MFS maltose permease n=1 Tax=Penicillium canescens TaxID=5083 RepID=A0AAD6N2Z4_PENCN|nr:uncharacterized protein N7446_004596 [Penicillium canescens]KAJ6009696.1 hypothetical protein N7522_004712 [Penicillium canescens]KAJ6026804.1 hypothetical protein N7460_011621 [Penicillium canescens]KAJ6040089.1 hypothetical protein N7444_008994 [Penicillium canescens]KAJ6067559.1 hypothetical protein N7446_004596 [Penicillium canescens]KAJ6085277.1 hypothetical protein N7499_004906 [Penicillium canescens]
MLPPRSAIGRIQGHIRPVLPPRTPGPNVHLRPFTQRTRLQLLSPAQGRPQLPFLSPLAPARPLPPLSIHLRQHFGRLISTESREHYKRRLSRGIKVGLSFYAILVLFSVVKLGVYQEDIEHSWPTPPEWSWKSRWCLRSAQAQQNPEQIGQLMTNWPMVAGYLRELLERLEDPEIEGKGIIEQDEGGFLVEGVGRTGLDVSAKSEPWRRGYFQALMGAAKAAENLDGWLTDRKQRISAPAEYVVGPSNPRPKPMPVGQKKVPHEEDCEQASPSPESFYMKVLTTRGFDTRQKLDAALAYADWLDFKGLGQTAGDMYTWALDIATGGLEGDVNKVVDMKNGVLKNSKGGDLPSENLLRVSTALAVHNARQGNLPMALSLFTSVLQARRNLPLSEDFSLPSFPSPHKNTNDIFTSLFKSIKNVLVPVTYPEPLPSGDKPPQRTSASACEEAGLMTYIGEILYAFSNKELGLAWTRDAVDMAESTMLDLGNSDNRDARTRCAQCVKVGLENWKTMVSSLVARSRKEEQESREQAKNAWFGGERRAQAKTLDRRRWEAEDAILEDRIRRLFPLLEGESGLDTLAPNSSLFV